MTQGFIVDTYFCRSSVASGVWGLCAGNWWPLTAVMPSVMAPMWVVGRQHHVRWPPAFSPVPMTRTGELLFLFLGFLMSVFSMALISILIVL